MKYTFDFSFLPGESLRSHDCRIVVDLLRASSQIVTFFDCGGEVLLPIGGVREAFELRDTLGDEWKLMGERGGRAPEGFDIGNSPSVLKATGAPAKAIMTTSNGTRTIARAAADCKQVLVGCARNAEAVAWDALCRGADIGIIASGRNGGFSMEDTVCAGMLTELLLALAPKNGAESIELTDGAIAASALWRYFGRDLEAVSMESEHGRNLQELGFAADIRFCCEAGASAVVPRISLQNGLYTITAG